MKPVTENERRLIIDAIHKTAQVACTVMHTMRYEHEGTRQQHFARGVDEVVCAYLPYDVEARERIKNSLLDIFQTTRCFHD